MKMTKEQMVEKIIAQNELIDSIKAERKSMMESLSTAEFNEIYEEVLEKTGRWKEMI